MVLLTWIELDAMRCNSLTPFLSSPDHGTRATVVGTLAVMAGLPHAPGLEAAHLALLRDPDPNIRGYAAMSLIDPTSIPTLVAQRGDSDATVVKAVEAAIRRLRGTPPAPLR